MKVEKGDFDFRGFEITRSEFFDSNRRPAISFSDRRIKFNTIFDTMTEERTEFIPDEAVDQEDFRTTIMGMIDQLPDEQRAATMMYYFDEMSVKEIAQAQGVGENTVKGRLSYSRKAIKKSVEDYEKKNNVKLHCVGLLPLLLWLFRNYGKGMPVASAKAVAEGVSTATGVGICVAAGSGAVTTAVTTTAAVGLGAKLAAIPLAAKIGAGILAVALIAGAGTAVVMGTRDKATPTETTKNTEPQHTHSYTATTINATCTEKGEAVYTCACGDSYSEEVAATGHTYTASSTSATCTENGITVYTCTCGDTYTEEIAAKGHVYTPTTNEATCTEDGETVFTCTCGDSYTEVITAIGHAWGEWEVYQEPTTSAAGEKRMTCANCQEYQSEIIDRLLTDEEKYKLLEEELFALADDMFWLFQCTTGTFASIDEIPERYLRDAVYLQLLSS